MNIGLPLNTIINTDGYSFANVTNGYTTLTQPFSNQFGIPFYLIDGYNNIVADGYDGVLIADPNNPRQANFTSASVIFSDIVGLSSYQIVMLTPGVLADYGTFPIISINSISDVITLQKIYLIGDTLGQLLRADIDGDFVITPIDEYLLNNYIEREPLTQSPTSTYPAPSTNPYTKIGTTFNVIRFRLEKFVDRTDDYTPFPNTRFYFFTHISRYF